MYTEWLSTLTKVEDVCVWRVGWRSLRLYHHAGRKVYCRLTHSRVAQEITKLLELRSHYYENLCLTTITFYYILTVTTYVTFCVFVLSIPDLSLNIPDLSLSIPDLSLDCCSYVSLICCLGSLICLLQSSLICRLPSATRRLVSLIGRLTPLASRLVTVTSRSVPLTSSLVSVSSRFVPLISRLVYVTDCLVTLTSRLI